MNVSGPYESKVMFSKFRHELAAHIDDSRWQ
jgi:hypothetical protein